VGGNPELVAPDRGILVAPGDDKAFADAIERLLRDATMRAEFGHRGRQFARDNFTLERMRRRHEELYAELLEKKNWRAGRGDVPPPRDRLRVALVAASPRYVGGQSVQADLLIQHWQNDPAVAARFIPIDPPLPRPIAWIERIPVIRTLFREPFYMGALWRGVEAADIVHIFSASYWSFLIAPLPAWLIARLRGANVIIHYHSGEARDHLRRFRSVRPVLEDADRLVVPSGYLANVFHEFGLHAQVVPNIVELKRFTFRERKPLRPRLLCTRGFHRYYSLDVVVRAIEEIQRGFPEATLDLVGTGPLEPQVRKLVQELNLSGVNFAGAVPHPRISHFYDAADIFINASNLDNMPVSILEAFASGTPVVTTAPEGMSYLVEHERTGLLSAPGDPRTLSANVMRLLKDPGLASRLAFNAYEEAQGYSWGAVRQQWLDIYRSLQCGVTETAPGSLAADQAAARSSGRIA
jgi:L-malate glycosyltransferase